MSEEKQIPDNLRFKFPELRPIKRMPTLHTINGIGLTVYGRRALDAETGTYIKTYCFCLFFIPIFAITAYRVADAGARGWYFIGKEPLSQLAKIWNSLVLALILLGVGILVKDSYLSSPDYQAKQKLHEAAALMKAGKPLEAAGAYRVVATGNNSHADEGRAGLRDALEQCLNSDSPPTIQGAFQIIHGVLNGPAHLTMVDDPFQRGVAIVEKFRAKNPEGALTVLHAAAPFARTNAQVRPVEIGLLRAIVATHPDNVDRTVELALIYEEDNQLDESYQVLAPAKAKLGSTEGARILGQRALQQENFEEAYGLLFPYVQTRLDKLQQIEQSYTNALAAAYHRAIDSLNENRADTAFYTTYERASKAERETMVDNYVGKWMQADPAFKRASDELRSANKIIHVTLDLGIVQLNRAQSLTDPAARKTELEAAEKTFLAIHGLANITGDSDEYRLFLGQVYYWLGKADQAKKMFDELLAANHRSYPTLMALSRTFREVGEQTQARALTEEAYRTAKDDRERFTAASLRARLPTDINDEIVWLEKCDLNEAFVQIELNSARGEKALQDGNRDLAADHFRKAVAGYEKMTRNAVTLNNYGLACLNLYEVTGDLADHNRGLALLEEAVALNPGNSLMLMNTAQQLFTRAYMDVVDKSIRFEAIKATPDSEMLHCLYDDEPGRAQVFQRLHDNECMKKALGYLDKALLLAPKNASLYWWEVHVQSGFRDLGELQKLQQRLQVASPDLAELRQETLAAYAGGKEAEHLAQTRKEIQRLQKILETPAVADHALSREFVRIHLQELQMGLTAYGENADSAKLLAEARALAEQHPDTATRDVLIAALFFRAHADLRQQSTEYARLADQTRRVLSGRMLLTLLLDRNATMADLIRKNPNVLQAAELLQDRARRFPAFVPVTDWALLQALDPKSAAAVRHQVEADQAARISDRIEYELNPLIGSSVLEQYWTRKLAGDDAGATKIYDQAVRAGVPLPKL